MTLKGPLTRMTPAEIDEQWFPLMERRAKAEHDVVRAKHLLEEPETLQNAYSRIWAKQNLPEYEATLHALQEEEKPFAAEWERRGGWTRYPLVLERDGHYHRDTNCSTCFPFGTPPSSTHPKGGPPTRFGLQAHVSGLTERDLVERVGVDACTTCFPWAPATPAYQESIRRTADDKVAAKRQKLLDRKARLEKKVTSTRLTLERAERSVRRDYPGHPDAWYEDMNKYQRDSVRYAQQDLDGFLAEHPELAT